MAYVIERRTGGYAILHDIGKRELAQCERDKLEGWSYEPVSGARAHKWVKAGGLHSTDLYIRDDGRIGKAGIGC